MNLRPPRAQQRLPPRGEPCDRRLPATSEASVAHGKPYAAPRYTPPHPTTPAPQKSLPSSIAHQISAKPLFLPINFHSTITKR